MSFGMKAQTTAGFIDLASVRSLQRVATVTETATSGSVAAPAGVTASTCLVLVVVNDTGLPPLVAFSGPTTINWTAAPANPSSNFTMKFLRFG